ncbi:hypothetical protein HDU98_012015 [Podochytrium sp. JEL0797]|nr:hypothetical protein HDU98_012015 [Podochytrium sp. JEL0797]
MPRQSDRDRELRDIKAIIDLLRQSILLSRMADLDDDEDQIADLERAEALHNALHSTRYISERVMPRNRYNTAESIAEGKLQYILVDSAYTAGIHIIPAYKKPIRGTLTRAQEIFNTLLTRIRIKAEHCIGMLKAKFQVFKRIRHLLDGEFTMREIVDLITVCCILHNICLGDADDEFEVEERRQDDAEVAAAGVGCSSRRDEDAEIQAGKERRDRLRLYFEELGR